MFSFSNKTNAGKLLKLAWKRFTLLSLGNHIAHVNYDSTFCWIWFHDRWSLVWTEIFISVSNDVKTLAHLQWYCNFAPRNLFIFSHQRWLSMREEVIMCSVHSWMCFCTIYLLLQPTVVMQMKLFWSMSIGHFFCTDLLFLCAIENKNCCWRG